MELTAIKDAIDLYRKHGWELRRILASSPEIRSFAETFDVEIREFSIPAAWFARPRRPGRIAWEIRYLDDPPFALLEALDEDDPAFEEELRAVEERLLRTVSGRA